MAHRAAPLTATPLVAAARTLRRSTSRFLRRASSAPAGSEAALSRTSPELDALARCTVVSTETGGSLSVRAFMRGLRSRHCPVPAPACAYACACVCASAYACACAAALRLAVFLLRPAPCCLANRLLLSSSPLKKHCFASSHKQATLTAGSLPRSWSTCSRPPAPLALKLPVW